MKPKIITALACVCFTNFANAEVNNDRWSGLYGGIDAGGSRINAKASTWTIDTTSPIGGGRGTSSGSDHWFGSLGGVHLGYNWVLPNNVLLGLEGGFGASSLKHNAEGISQYGISYKTYNLDNYLTGKGKIGYIVNDWIFYGLAGVTSTRLKTSNTQGPCGDGNTPPGYSVANCSSGPYTAVPYGTKDSSSHNLLGWTVGAGAEVAINQFWSAKLEYVYTDFGSVNVANPSFNRESSYKFKTDTLQIGINYKF